MMTIATTSLVYVDNRNRLQNQISNAKDLANKQINIKLHYLKERKNLAIPFGE
jgi:hypothetical protein